MSKEWKELQLKLRSKVLSRNTEAWQDQLEKGNSSLLQYIGGLDVSFVKNSNTACVGLVVIDIHANFKVVYENFSVVEITESYIPGYLSFREADFYVNLLEKINISNPDIYPQCLLVDGNGYLHVRRFGLACHVGVLCNIPTVGVAKKPYRIENCINNLYKKEIKENLLNEGDFFELKTNEGEVLGCCLRNRGSSPIYISVGHKISLSTSIKVVTLTSPKYRIPEPIRLADIKTREILRNMKF